MRNFLGSTGQKSDPLLLGICKFSIQVFGTTLFLLLIYCVCGSGSRSGSGSGSGGGMYGDDETSLNSQQ